MSQNGFGLANKSNKTRYLVARSVSLALPIRRRKSMCIQLEKIGLKAVQKNSMRLRVKDRKNDIDEMDQQRRRMLQNQLLSKQQNSQKNLQLKKQNEIQKLIQQNKRKMSRSQLMKRQKRSILDRSFASSQKKRKEMQQYFQSRQQSKRSTLSNFRSQTQHINRSFQSTICPRRCFLKLTESPKVNHRLSQSVNLQKLNQYIIKKQSHQQQRQQRSIDKVVKKIVMIQALKNKKQNQQMKIQKPTPKRSRKIFVNTLSYSAKNPEKETHTPVKTISPKIIRNKIQYHQIVKSEYLSKRYWGNNDEKATRSFAQEFLQQTIEIISK